MKGYREDLAYIHDQGFGDFATNAAPALLALFRRHRIREGLVIDLGCGPGHWARELTLAGYDVLGVDISPAMIRLARQKAPLSLFRTGSLLRAHLPPCAAVTAMGECLNYTFDPSGGVEQLFHRVFHALQPGGLFVFDVATPDRVPAGGPKRSWKEGRDWAVLVESSGDRKQRTLTRHIVCFRKLGGSYRRSEETHVLRLFDPRKLSNALKSEGFEVSHAQAYGRLPMLAGVQAFIATKPLSE